MILIILSWAVVDNNLLYSLSINFSFDSIGLIVGISFVILVNSSFVIIGIILLDVTGASIFKDRSLIGLNK
ncbi:MAG: hypothetical protein PUA97_00525 [bacterium]|nr:hypothetical protein [bacterium]